MRPIRSLVPGARPPAPPGAPPRPAPPRPPAEEAIAFLLSLARALHAYGTTAHRLEDALDQVARRLGIEGSFFSTPTAVFASLGPPGGEPRTAMIRVEPGEEDLGKLARLDRLTAELSRGETTVAEARRRMAEIVAAPPRYGPLPTVASWALVSAAAARFFGGGAAEVAAGGAIGLAVGLLARLAAGRPALARVFHPLAAALAAAAAGALAATVTPLAVYVATLSGLIVLVPGITVTVAIAELATKNLASGSARLAGALAVFLTLAFGVALGSTLAVGLLGAPPPVAPTPLPDWTEWLALALAPFAFTVIFRAAPRDAPWIWLAGVAGFVGVRAGGVLLGPQLGAFAGALVVGLVSNLTARALDRPAAVTLVPGLVLLVPGSIGFQSLTALLARDVLSGVETAFRMTLVAVALVTGLLVANVLSPPRRAL